MKKIFTLIAGVCLYVSVNAQQCTTSGFDVCSGISPVTSFTNPVQVPYTGSYLSVGSKYKFHNVTPGIDAIVTIEKMVNAKMIGSGVESPNIDDDTAPNETNVPGTQAALFAPRIAADIELGCSPRTGYVQFKMEFYAHTSGSSMPSSLLKLPILNPNFLHFDMDGHEINPGGYFREVGWVKRTGVAPINPVNIATVNTLLSGGNLLVTDSDGSWFRTNGATEEREGVSRCSQVIEKSVYLGAQFEISFRFGYEYKPRNNCNYYNANEGQPTRQFGSKIGCFELPNAAPLPVSLTGLAVNYNNGIANLRWNTSQEINIDEYIVERSTDGTVFEAIGNVTARNLLTLQQYDYADRTIPQFARTVFYRVRIKERDARFSLSNVVNVKVSNEAINGIMITPNPSTTDAQVRFTSQSAGNATIYIYDAAGKMVSQQNASVSTGNNNITLNNITRLNEGVYVVKLVSDRQTYSTKLMVWK